MQTRNAKDDSKKVFENVLRTLDDIVEDVEVHSKAFDQGDTGIKRAVQLLKERYNAPLIKPLSALSVFLLSELTAFVSSVAFACPSYPRPATP